MVEPSAHPDIDLRAQIVRIDRAIAESEKLREETRKFITEQHKLAAEAAKLDRERVWFPWLQLLTVVISSAAIGAVVARLFHG